jgi:spore photoproduct lyase
MNIDTLFIHQDIKSSDETDYIFQKLGLNPVSVSGTKQVYSFINEADDPVLRSKKTLYITKNQGAVIKECPGTSHYTCCNYTILHTGTFCTMDCSYCILQAYFHPPVLQYFSGLDELSGPLDAAFGRDKILRIGTGEYTDSLIWEKISMAPGFLVKKFADQKNCMLELKTKTVNVKSLLDLNHNGKTIIAWSVNTPEIISSEERGTASLISRLEAVKRCQEKGYKIAFHFDPVIIYDGCEDAYKNVVKLIFEYVHPENIVWMSIGTFRFMPGLKQVIENRFPESKICYGEFILGLDNKMRYFKPLRIRMYKKLIASIREYEPDLLIYFCMEDQEIWEKCLGFFPKKEGQLGHMLDKSAALHCGLNSDLL